jgi:hypothetical protein
LVLKIKELVWIHNLGSQQIKEPIKEPYNKTTGSFMKTIGYLTCLKTRSRHSSIFKNFNKKKEQTVIDK